jgi:hypothetical protein
MNNSVRSPLLESMMQRGAGQRDQWRGYITILVVNHGILKYIGIVSAIFAR